MSDDTSYTNSRWFTRLTALSDVVSKAAVIFGVIVGLVQLDSLKRGWDASNQAAKLQSLGYIQKFIEEDFEIQKRLDAYDAAKVAMLENKAQEKTGHTLYFSNELDDLPTIGEHFERMGAEVKLEYLDFSLLFEVVPFPDNFWEETRKIRAGLRANWGGKGHALPDLWSNFGYLCERYRTERRKSELDQPLRPETDVKGCQS